MAKPTKAELAAELAALGFAVDPDDHTADDLTAMLEQARADTATTTDADGAPTPAPPGDDPDLAALEHERGGYVARGLDDRVAEVDAAIERRRKASGHETAT